MRMLEASWCGWYSASRNVVLMHYASIPMKHGLSSPAQHMRDLLEREVCKSFFLRGSTAKCDSFSERLAKALKPDWTCPLGESDSLLGWLSPGFMYATDEAKGPQFWTDFTGFMRIDPSDLPPPELFRNRVREVESSMDGSGLKRLDSTDALTLSRIEGHSLVDDPQMYTADTAELVEEFEQLPSPMFHLGESLSVATVWKVEMAALSRVGPDDITQADSSLNVGITPAEKNFVYLRVTKSVRTNPTLSATENIRDLKLDEWILQIRKAVTNVCPDAVLETGRYWHDVIGLRY
ncbi:hypothetical protein [Nannocystis pusilla]|uniref:hypothetical protein n=1 Tax=Nannocystis pusilla TaxID=889268 RepID=UPI003B7AFE90